jgi:APA family basic amino acid/polyamine antiporter
MPNQLKRHIGPTAALFYGLGVILGAGIYVLVAPAAGFAGNAVWLSFLIAATLATFTGLAYAELGSMFPKAAAEYVYIKRAYRSHVYAFMLGWLIIFTGIVSISTVSLGFTGYLSDLLGTSPDQTKFLLPGISAAMILVMGLVNYVGIRETSRMNIVMTSIVILGLLIVIAIGVWSGGFATTDYFQMPNGLNGVFVAASLIFFAYLGFEEIVNVAEETRNPRKVLPKAIMLSILISTVLYVLTAMAIVGLEGWQTLAESKAPLSDAVQNVFGHNAGLVISVIALVATTSTVLGLILVVSRMIWGMSREGALPSIFAHVNLRGTPSRAIIVVMLGAMAFVFLGDIAHVASITSIGALFIFLNINLALIWLRYTEPNLHRPFRTPLNIGKYPVMGGLGVFISLFMMMQFNLEVFLTGVVVSVVGLAAFIVYKKRDFFMIRQLESFLRDLRKEAER